MAMVRLYHEEAVREKIRRRRGGGGGVGEEAKEERPGCSLTYPPIYSKI